MEDWAEIRRLRRAEQMPIKQIARHMGISRNTVKRALASDEPPRYRRAPKGSIVDAAEPQIRALLAEFPRMPATVIAERIGWPHGMTVLKQRVAELRPTYLPVDPVSRTAYQAGELGQCDLWFPPVDIPLGYGQAGRPPVLVMISGYSRVITARMLPSRSVGDLLDGMWRLLGGWRATPRVLVWDNEAAIGRNRGGKVTLTSEVAWFAGLLGIKVHIVRPRDPEAKGLVERANGYLETSFLPGRVFRSPGDFNARLDEWLGRANRRFHRGLQARPADRWEADRVRMLPVAPAAAAPHWWRFFLRISRDHYVRVDTNDYSVHPDAIGRTVSVRVTNTEVSVVDGSRVMAQHARCWAHHQTLTDPEHAAAAAALRAQAAATRHTPPAGVEVQARDLASYDRVFQVIDGGATDEGVA